MALATQPSEATLVWEQAPTSQVLEWVFSVSLTGVNTFYNRTHHTGRCRFLFMTKAAATALVTDLCSAHTSSYEIQCKNGKFKEFPYLVGTVAIGGGAISAATVGKWTAQAVLRSDGIGYDVEVIIDYDVISAQNPGGE